MTRALLFTLFTAFFWSLSAAAEGKVQVAITFDDLPAAGIQGQKSRKQVADALIGVLQKHHLTGVYGFMNGILAKDMAERQEILREWKKAGNLIGNHTYSHPGLSAVGAAKYIEDIEKNEPFLIDFASSIPELKIFRYPYLDEGETQDQRYEVRSYLSRRGYQIAYVSLDFKDWNWNEPFVRCEQKKDTGELEMLKRSYLDFAVKELHYLDAVSRRLLGRSVKLILLVHFSPVTAEYLDELLSLYEKNGVEFIPLADALKDPFYAQDTTYVGKVGLTSLLQFTTATHYNLSVSIPSPPQVSLTSVCN